MKLSPASAWRTFCFFLFLALTTLILPCLLIPLLQRLTRHVSDEADHNLDMVLSLSRSEIEHTASTLEPLATATALSRVLESSLGTKEFSFSDVSNKVAPILFQTLVTAPYAAEISYIGLNGLFFSYCTADNRSQVVALYANSSFNSNYTWYKQPADPNSGNLFGDAIQIQPGDINSGWLGASLNSSNGYSSIGTGWNQGQDLMLLNGAGVSGNGVVSEGTLVSRLVETLANSSRSLYLASEDGKVLLQGLEGTRYLPTTDSIMIQVTGRGGYTRNCTCRYGEGMSMTLEGRKYRLYCASLTLLGKKLVYALAVPVETRRIDALHEQMNMILWVLTLLIITAGFTVVNFVFLFARAAQRQMHLCSALIKQMEATQQAERKSKNKSTAFAQASHDIRASLAGIMGLIELSYDDVGGGPELHKNLRQMETCAKDLLALLNSILDTSKIEAGKMLLEEEEFDLMALLEDVVDLYHPVALKKGVDVILDLHNGSVLKSSLVRGDRGKLKQILSNLLSNAVKFTSEGHILVRAWVRKPNLENIVVTSPQNRWQKILAFLCCCRYENYNDINGTNTSPNNRNCADFVFEVSDTGPGIPKEKRRSVFENYIQVKETNRGQGGTGLGLGIVRSLVHLMGGGIEIIDKEIGENGTCFRFNILLAAREVGGLNGLDEVDKLADQSLSCQLGSTLRSLTRALSIGNASSRHLSSPNSDGSSVILLMQSDERCRVTQRFMKRLGIQVFVVNQLEDLHSVSKRIPWKLKTSLSSHSSSGTSEISYRTDSLRKSTSIKGRTAGAKDVAYEDTEGTDQILQDQMRTSRIHPLGVVLLVVDATIGPFPQLLKAVAEFRKGSPRASHRVVWLDKPMTKMVDRGLLMEGSGDLIHLIMSKPLHGTRLFEVIKLLPEFMGPTERMPLQLMSGAETPAEKVSTSATQEIVSISEEKPLNGKKVLVVDDTEINRRIAERSLHKLGANVHLCRDGSEALELVCDGLRKQRQQGPRSMLPYDYIFMDCQMPKMDGYEATRRIREEEKEYGVRIPIIALTAHDSGLEVRRIFEVGMDFHLSRPLSKERLMEAIASIHCT